MNSCPVFFLRLFSSFSFSSLLPPPDTPFLTADALLLVSLRSLRAKKNFASGLVRRVDSQVVRTRRRSPKSHESLTKP